MFDFFKQEIAEALAPLAGLDSKVIFDAVENAKIAAHGDLAVAIPRLRLKGNPKAIAEEWVAKFQPTTNVLSCSAAGPFINFRINRPQLAKLVLDEVYERKETFGTNDSNRGKRAIVEFSSPNIAKPFHAGHLRSTIIGNFVRNALIANGWEVIAMNYLGDWGKQYGLLAVGFERYGSDEALAADPIHHLYEVYVKINRDAEEDPAIHDQARVYFRRMEDGDETALALWKRFRDMSIEKYHATYDRLNINFDVYSGESQVTYGMKQAMDLLESHGLVEESEGAKIIDLEKYKMGKAVLQKKDGTTLYLTRDIGAAIERWDKYKFDTIFYIVASQQDLHLQQLFKILQLLELPYADRFKHINFGLVTGMSTRKGTAVFLQDMLEQTKEKMHDVMRANEDKYAQIEDPERVADVVGMSAITVQDMSAKRIRNYDFNWQRMFSFEGDTGPYLQYAHARLCSVERNSALTVRRDDVDLTLLSETAAQDLLDHIARYPALVASLPGQFEPVNVVGYAFKLSHLVSSAYEVLRVNGAPADVAQARLLLYWAARITLGNAMRMVGLVPLERM
ncbi:arginyl-tRNA synthetase [Tieghemiomyces parasiticus]|uniref:arginine--tRNA ligase n=1 Tax=Tieghemiomyces parasiticus TaxID=78921 RepID=A0A9W8AGK8_9FUNG|nr:arginyl-tRNA synthetase [Tieghemiomyces parasiticus]